MSAAVVVLAAAVAFCAYTFAGYPALLRVLARRVAPGRRARRDWPCVSITIPAYNEEGSIGGTLERLLALDYPAERLQILVVSDASTDATDQIVAGFADRGVELLRLPRRAGKTAAENAAFERLSGEIVVNTDASARLERGALRALVAALADPEVGVASARDLSVARLDDTASAGEGGYIGYEMWLRDLETRAGGIVGASGCCYAIRAALHRTPLSPGLSRDFAAALVARERGFSAVSVPQALCRVPRAASLGTEYRRKVRTVTRGLLTLWEKRPLLDLRRYGRFAWMLASHKLCRWLVPWALAAGAGAVLVLAGTYGWARWIAGAGAVATALAAVGWLWPEGRPMPRALALAAFGLASQVAVLHAWLRALRGGHMPIWEPTRRDARPVEATTPPA